MPFNRLPDAVHQVEVIKKGVRDRDGSIDLFPTLLEGVNDEGLIVEIDAAWSEGQGLRNAAPGIVQDAAQRPDGPVGLGSSLQKGVTLGGGQIQASAFGVVELGGRVHDCNRILEAVS
jgi:hypothetical protein